jgi:hypothetical protein
MMYEIDDGGDSEDDSDGDSSGDDDDDDVAVMVTVMAIAVVVAIVSPESFAFTVWIRETTGTSGTIPVEAG